MKALSLGTHRSARGQHKPTGLHLKLLSTSSAHNPIPQPRRMGHHPPLADQQTKPSSVAPVGPTGFSIKTLGSHCPRDTKAEQPQEALSVDPKVFVLFACLLVIQPGVVANTFNPHRGRDLYIYIQSNLVYIVSSKPARVRL